LGVRRPPACAAHGRKRPVPQALRPDRVNLERLTHNLCRRPV